MTADDRFVLLLAGLLAIAVCVTGAQLRERGEPGLADRPRIGRSIDEVTAGPDPEFPRLQGSSARRAAESRREAMSRVEAFIGTGNWPIFAKAIVFHPIVGDELPQSDLEEGPPFHVVIFPDGRSEWTPRGRRSALASPPGIPTAEAARALHVVILSASSPSRARDATVRAWWFVAAARAKSSRNAALFADEVPGSTAAVPTTFDRANCVPTAAELEEILK